MRDARGTSKTVVRISDPHEHRRTRRRPLESRPVPVWVALAIAGGQTAFSLEARAQAPPPRPDGPTAAANQAIESPSGMLTRPAGTPRADSTSRPNNGASSPWPTLVLSLCVVGLVVVGARWWRRHGPRLRGVLPDEVLVTLGRRTLDARHAIQLVRLGHRILVLGSSPDGLRTLTEIEDPVEVDYLSGLCRSQDERSLGDTFGTLFRRRTSEQPPAGPPAGEPGATPPAARATTTAPRPPARGDEHGDANLRRRLSERLRGEAAAPREEVSR